MKREGQAGGFKELDEQEIEEAKKRRKQQDDEDDELYDEFGRVKKKYRNDRDRAAREAAALDRLWGEYDPSASGQEPMTNRKGRQEGQRRDWSNDRERDKDLGKYRKPSDTRDRDRGAKDWDGGYDKEHGRERDRDRGRRDRGRDRHRR